MSNEELIAIAPKANSLWKHTSGRIYEFLFLSNTDSININYPITAIYRNIANDTIWSRPLNDWHRSMEWIADAGDNT